MGNLLFISNNMDYLLSDYIKYKCIFFIHITHFNGKHYIYDCIGVGFFDTLFFRYNYLFFIFFINYWNKY